MNQMNESLAPKKVGSCKVRIKNRKKLKPIITGVQGITGTQDIQGFQDITGTQGIAGAQWLQGVQVT